ncbi:MAG: ATP-binding cassette domain-containing protein [Bacteroidetes bacterium]|nr:ATP-binding cassette domain-containing protein [Bacteroidota bacterium]
MKIRKIHIANFKIFNNVDIDLTTHGKPMSLLVLAGINGSGKSSLLEFIFDFLTGKKPAYSNENNIIGEKFDVETGKNIRVSYSTGTKSNIDQISEPEIKYNKLEKNNVAYFKTYDTDVQFARSVIIKFIDRLIFEKDIKSSDAFHSAQELLNQLFDGFNLKVGLSKIDKERNLYFKNESNERISISQLSKGEQELIAKAFALYLDDSKEKIILIDEPESSLHPNWQNRILKIYEDFAIKNNNQIIIATHSPHIIASAKKESLRLLVNKNGKIDVISDFEGSYGYEVQRVLLEIMNLESLRIPGISEKIEILFEMVHSDKYKTERFLQLQSEMEGLLGRNDKDLMLLRLEVAKRKKLNEKNQ